MKKMTNIFACAAIAFFVAGIFSCSNMQDSGAQVVGVGLAVSKSAYITIELNESVAKTVLPDIQDALFTDLVLKGAKTGETQTTLGSWATASQMQTASVPLELGTWNFTLAAKSGGSSFSATAQKEIVAGKNALLFNLALVDGGTQKGSFSISLSFAAAQNANLVTSAVATLEDMDGNALSGYKSKNLAINDSAVVFDGSDIAAGTYRARIKFFALSNGTNFEIASYRELVQISSGFCSTASREIESFDELYTITYVLNGGSFASGTSVPETFSRKTTAVLPENITRDWRYRFCGWYTDENCSIGKEISMVENLASNVIVYAKWLPVYTVSYVLNGGVFLDETTTTEDVVEGDSVNLKQNVNRNGCVFGGWYSDEGCSVGNELTKIKNVSRDVAVYAKWNLITYKITYDYNPESGEENVIQNYTVEDNVELLNPAPVNGFFGGWYENEDFTGAKITGWNAGEKYKDIVLYSSCSMAYDVDSSTIVGVINNIKKSGSITVTGVLNSTVIQNVKSALVALNEARPKVRINLYMGDVTDIGNYGKISVEAFCNCNALYDVYLPKCTKIIGQRAFYGCSNLHTITLPKSVGQIDEEAFRNAESLFQIVIPENVTKIGKAAFVGCASLKTAIFVDNTSDWYKTVYSDYSNGVWRGAFDSQYSNNATILRNATDLYFFRY